MKHDWTEKMSGFRKMAEVPVATLYDTEPDNSESFSLCLNISSTPEVTITKSVNKSEEEVAENEYKKEGQVKHVIKELFSGNTEGYLNWKHYLDHVLNIRPYESSKAKVDMAEAMMFGDQLESWKTVEVV